MNSDNENDISILFNFVVESIFTTPANCVVMNIENIFKIITVDDFNYNF